MNRTHLLHSAEKAFVATVLIVAFIMLSYVGFEPSVGRSATEIFQVTQTISGAISFLASTSPVAMQGTLDGLSGGTSWGTTTSRVRTNNSTGYNMTLTFASITPMVRNNLGGSIPTFLYSTGTVTYPAGFTTAVPNAQFGFSVNASNTAEVSGVFKGDGSTVCGTGAGSTFAVNVCWRGASSTNAAASTQLINSTAPTPSSGSTTTLQFRITIPNNPSPAVPDGTYTATATLTATEN